jgi:hypothetical protein
MKVDIQLTVNFLQKTGFINAKKKLTKYLILKMKNENFLKSIIFFIQLSFLLSNKISEYLIVKNSNLNYKNQEKTFISEKKAKSEYNTSYLKNEKIFQNTQFNSKFIKEFEDYSKQINLKNQVNNKISKTNQYTFEMNDLIKNSINLPILNDSYSSNLMNNTTFELKNSSYKQSNLDKDLVKQALSIDLNTLGIDNLEKESKPIILPIFNLK